MNLPEKESGIPPAELSQRKRTIWATTIVMILAGCVGAVVLMIILWILLK